MKFTLISGEDREDEVVVYANGENELIKTIKELCERNCEQIVGYDETGIYKVSPFEIICFVSDGDRLYAHTKHGRLRIKSRLSKIEQGLPALFVRINQSCIANISMIERFDASFSGTLGVIFKNGYRDYVSRRNLKKVKERIGI